MTTCVRFLMGLSFETMFSSPYILSKCNISQLGFPKNFARLEIRENCM